MGSIIDRFVCSCGEQSVVYETHPRRRWVKFWISPDLPLEKVLHVLKGKRFHKEDGTYDFKIKCPACGKWSLTYNGIPNDVKAYLPNDLLVLVSIEEIIRFAPEAIVATNDPEITKKLDERLKDDRFEGGMNG